MFVARFAQTSGEPFTADKNTNYPFIGTVLAGKATNAIMNGTMFQRENLETGVLYLCDNVTEIYEDKPQVNTIVIGKVSTIEFMALRTQLGAGTLKRETVPAEGAGADPGAVA